MIAILGWVLFSVTIVVAVWRDIAGREAFEKRYDDALRYWEAKHEQTLNAATLQDNFEMRKKLANVRKAING